MIGIFDSGVGGMTVARAIEHICPDYPLVYFGDIARTPYGSKSPETIIEYSRRNTEFLLSHGATIIVIACNSAASVATKALQKDYPVPVIDVITPATIKAAAVTRSKRIGVIGTRATVRSGVYTERIQAIDSGCKVISKACPLLVPLVEEGWLNKRETKMILRRYLYSLKLRQIDTLVLGCTHYPLLSKLIQPRIGKRVRLIDSSIEVALHLKEFLDNNADINNKLQQQTTESRFFVSDSTEPVRQLADRIFGRTINLEKVDA
jgi:glutamate racemase